MNSWFLLAAIPVFGLLVFVHELGHFLTAKWAGIRVEEFGLGFPPRLVGFRKRDRGGWEVLWFGRDGEAENLSKQTPFGGTSGGISAPDSASQSSDRTIYSLNFLPIGGFVRMPGESGDVYDEHGNYDQGSFASKSAGKRIIVLVAGVVMNILLAMILFTVAYGLGEPTYPAVIGSVDPDSPAAVAGLQPDDAILEVNGHSVKTFDDMRIEVSSVIKTGKGQQGTGAQATVPVPMLVQHKGDAQPSTIVVQARVNPPKDKGALGVGAKLVVVHSPLWEAPIKGIVHTFEVTRQFLSLIGQMIIGAIQPEIAGPVGIVNITGRVAETIPDIGWWPILNLTAILSLNLAIVNILPFPALDGGRIVLILLEIVRGGKRLKPEREGIINFIGMAILLALMVIITVSDVMRWGG